MSALMISATKPNREADDPLQDGVADSDASLRPSSGLCRTDQRLDFLIRIS